jgi:hypothetical protein
MGVPTFVLRHRHLPGDCRAAFAAWNGFDSPLRRRRGLASCASGGHSLYWTVEASSAREALALLPPFLAARADVEEVCEVAIP